MSALGRKVMDLAEQQGLLDGKAIAELRRQVAESKFVVTPEAIAKVLVDHGHLTPFQARKLVSQALGDQPDPFEQRAAEKARENRARSPVEELTLADDSDEKPVRQSSSSPPARVEEIVDLEVFEPADNPTTQRPAKGKKPASPGPPPARPGAKQHSARELDKPVEGSTADDFVELKAIDPAPHARGNRWKTDTPPTATSETIDMPPLDLSGPPAPMDVSPIDDLFEVGPIPKPAPRTAANQTSTSDTVAMDWFEPLKPDAGTATRTESSPLKGAKNVWDSPLLLVGGGALGVILVAFLLLLYALTRGTAAEMFNKAEEEYRSGSYAGASALYEKFLQKYPGDANASLARVRRSMATLRQVTDDGKNPRLGLETATQVLPQIETEEKFSEARSELATILPDIADGFATQASQAHDSARKAELVKSAGDALALVNNPAYLPASLRKDRESYISRIVDKLKAAERSIQQDKDLATAVERIAAATQKGDAAAAYQLQADLLRNYPGLATNSQLVAATRQVGEKERQLVAVSPGGTAPQTKDHAGGSEHVILPFYSEPLASAAGGRAAFLLIEGAVYGIDSANGRVLWRRFVGYETTNQPISLTAGGSSDGLFIDGRRHELVRVNGANGELIWRQELGDRAEGPVGADGRVFVTTRKGRVMAFEAATGKAIATAQLPQGAVVAPAVRQSRVYQPGEHSTLFVLDANSLGCSETVYLGHRAGEILVPPVAVLDQVLIITSPTDEYSEIQVLGPDGATKRLVPFGKPQRLKGRIITPPSVSGARIAAITDWGQVVVDEIDPAGGQEHWRLVAGLAPSETAPRAAYCELDRNRLWVTGHRRTLFEVQSALSQLARRWTENHDDSFLAPLRLAGDVLVQVRRRSGVSAFLVEGSRAGGGDNAETLWTTHLGSPIVALAPRHADQTAMALTAQGRLYALGQNQLSAQQAEKAEFSPGKNGAVIFDDVSISGDGQTLIWTESRAWGQVYVSDLKPGSTPAKISLPAEAAAPAVSLGGGIVVPLSNGTVVWLAREGGAKAAPFMPPLVPDALPLWTKPTVLADDRTFLISDGRSIVYAVTKKDAPQLQLALVGQSSTSGPIASPLVQTGSTGFGVIRQERSDAVGGFDARGAATFEPIPLQGRVEAGPFAVGGLALVAAEPDGLVCIASDGKIRWQLPPDRGPIAGPPAALPEGDLLIAFQSGIVCRLDASSGKELAQHDVGEPLAGPVCLVGQQVLLAGSDGVVHRISIPPRP